MEALAKQIPGPYMTESAAFFYWSGQQGIIASMVVQGGTYLVPGRSPGTGWNIPEVSKRIFHYFFDQSTLRRIRRHSYWNIRLSCMR
jgi:hypothetical protein